MSSDKKILATIVLEMIGKPPEHLVDTLKKLIKEIGEEKEVKVLDSKINEPKEMEKHKGFFSTFSEIDLEVENILNLVNVVFKYMPSHVEIVSPENLKISNTSLNSTLNELTRRLHAYDQVVRVIQNEKEILEKKLKESSEKKEEKK